MTIAYQGPVGAVFVEPVPGGRIRLTVQDGRTYAHIEIDVDDVGRVIGHIQAATTALDPQK